MQTHKQRTDLRIWGLALGYFLLYIPYSVLSRAVSMGLWPGIPELRSGFEMLPAAGLATALVMPGIVTALGWWKYLGRRTCFGITLPWPSRWAVLSGICFAVIIHTTTLAYTFSDISVLLALLLMRGGVLSLAPLVDVLCKRAVYRYSWIAWTLSLLAIGVALADVKSYALSVAVVLNLAAYLAGYVGRLRTMTRQAKCADEAATRRYFTEEMLVAMLALALVPAILAWIGLGDEMLALRRGFTTVLASDLTVPALLVGVCYAGLGVCGSLIYLDRRENTFAILVNRCASVLSGVIASGVLTICLSQPSVSLLQYGSTGIILLALLILSLPTLKAAVSTGIDTIAPALRQWLVLFVCSGNTSRSPMAQAICQAEIARKQQFLTALGAPQVQILSAGLAVQPGAPMTSAAQHALQQVGVPVVPHRARPLTDELVQRARVIFCMTYGQQQTLLTRFPEAATKTYCLDPDGDVADPSGAGVEAFLNCARQLQHLIQGLVEDATRLLYPVCSR